jgi:hypothetical protein
MNIFAVVLGVAAVYVVLAGIAVLLVVLSIANA